MTLELNWPRAYDFERPIAALKQQNADFQVIERLPEEPSGEGEHLWLTVRKDGQNTAWVARQLASWAGCSQRDVSYAGLKDRNAVTEQTFSLHLPGRETPDLQTLQIEGVEVLSAVRHQRKLKTGQLIGNSFIIRLRDCSIPAAELEPYWQRLVEGGVPNYFGPQRFGHGGRNVSTGLEWLRGQRKLPRHQQSIHLSAVRSFLFNRLLAERVAEGTWNRLIEHDFAQFTEGKAGFYCETPSPEDIQRCQLGQLSPAASLPGDSRDEFTGLELREAGILTDCADVISALKRQRVARHFRKLRLLPEQPAFSIVDGDPVCQFFLPAGAYATAVMSELVDWQSAAGDWHE